MTTAQAGPELPTHRMNVDEYLAWAEENPGRYELDHGRIVAMSSERAGHVRVKFRVQQALAAGIARAGLPCEMLPDGMTVRVDERTAYEPDALVHCGERPGADAIEAPEPVIVVEVASPDVRSLDPGRKTFGYLALPSIAHYLLIGPKQRMVVHHRRVGEDRFETRILDGGTLRLDPPGIEIAVADLFAGS